MQEPKQTRRGDEVSHLISDNQEDDEMEKRERENKQTNYQLLMAFLLNSQYNMTDTRQVFFLFFVEIPTLCKAISMDMSSPHLHLTHKLECAK